MAPGRSDHRFCPPHQLERSIVMKPIFYLATAFSLLLGAAALAQAPASGVPQPPGPLQGMLGPVAPPPPGTTPPRGAPMVVAS